MEGDYSKYPCELTLKDLAIVDVGKINVEITGLGPFNDVASDIISWITETSKKDIITAFHGVVTSVLQKLLSEFDCKNNNPFA